MGIFQADAEKTHGEGWGPTRPLQIKDTSTPASFHHHLLAPLIEMKTFQMHVSVKFSSQVIAAILCHTNITS